MRIIYVHHAEREDSGNRENKDLACLEDITPNGIKEAELLAQMSKELNIKAIITSPYKRCLHTAQIINKYHNAPIIEDDRFNELDFYNNENFKSLLKRNMKAIDDIVKKYNNDDTIICVTSGVNLTAFICYFYKIRPSKHTPWCGALSMSPVFFEKQV